MRSDPFDFNVFQSRVLLSQRKDTPLQENLRELMSSVLGKAIEYSGYQAALHLFVNQILGEVHVMPLCRGTASWRAVDELAFYREGLPNAVDFSALPQYHRIEIPRDSAFFASLNWVSDPYPVSAPGELTEKLILMTEQCPAELAALDLGRDDKLIAVPLARGDFSRLGALLLVGPPPGVSPEAAVRGREGEALLEFGRGISRLLVRIFAGFYGMHPHTYLPSYHHPKQQDVALLSAELRHFDRIARALQTREDMNGDERRGCLRELVNRFSETVADVVEQYRGRIDQLWGGGLLAVFGEYLDSPRDAQVAASMRAVQTAAVAVKLFREAKKRWLDGPFRLEDFRRHRQDHVTTDLAIAISFGKVELDYLGSRDHRFYMTFGDQVSFVKELTKRACRTELDEDHERLDSPILVSQPAFVAARKDCIRDKAPDTTGTVDRAELVRLPGRQELFPVYKLWPENVTMSSP